MKRSSSTPDAPTLFELPEQKASERSFEPDPAEVPDNLELFAEAVDGEPELRHQAPVPRRGGSLTGARARAGLLDLAVIALVLAVIVGGTALMGVSPGRDAWPALLLVAAVFSFLYSAVPLAFWGHTPGMARYRVAARNEGNRPLTFGQTFLRWAGAAVTVALAGLPALLVLTGRSLPDRLSGSRTLLRG